jgi:hypothetical protein
MLSTILHMKKSDSTAEQIILDFAARGSASAGTGSPGPTGPGPEDKESAPSACAPAVGHRRARALGPLAVIVALYTLGWVAFFSYALTAYSVSYYVVDYDFGFVRRGLAGEFALVMSHLPFASGSTLIDGAIRARWFTLVITLLGYGMLIALLAFSKPRSERRLMLALGILLLPGWVELAGVSQPGSLACPALALYSITLSRGVSSRLALGASLLYGSLLATLAFAHEAVVPMYALGAVLAIVVFVAERAAWSRLACAVLAVLPGIAATILIAAWGRSDTGTVEKICGAIPNTTVSVPLSGEHTYRSYAYAYELSYLDKGIHEAVEEVAALGPISLTLSTLIGMLIFSFTMWFIGSVSGTSFREFATRTLTNRLDQLMIFGALLLWVPIFAVAFDWLRFWSIIAINVALVYIPYCNNQPSIEFPAQKRVRKIFAVSFLVLLLFPPIPPAVPQIPLPKITSGDIVAANLSTMPPNCRD